MPIIVVLHFITPQAKRIHPKEKAMNRENRVTIEVISISKRLQAKILKGKALKFRMGKMKAMVNY